MTTRTDAVRGLIVWVALGLLCATLGCSGKEDAAATKIAAQGSDSVAAPAKPESAPAKPAAEPAPAKSEAAPVRPASAPATEPAKELTLDLGGGVTMKMILIRPGKFMMGSPVTEIDRFDNEVQHEVTISKPFYMGVTEVTQAQYEAVMGKNPSQFKGATNPVETVSWNDAMEFCKKLSDKTRQAVRLPTEAEWEYACRAGSKTKFSFGDVEEGLGDYAWYRANSDNTTHPVGQKKPNAWGLYDMHGNVFECCADWYGDYAKGAATDPSGPASGTARVSRGGALVSRPGYCCSALRRIGSPDIRSDRCGFRVVVSVSAPGTK